MCLPSWFTVSQWLRCRDPLSHSVWTISKLYFFFLERKEKRKRKNLLVQLVVKSTSSPSGLEELEAFLPVTAWGTKVTQCLEYMFSAGTPQPWQQHVSWHMQEQISVWVWFYVLMCVCAFEKSGHYHQYGWEWACRVAGNKANRTQRENSWEHRCARDENNDPMLKKTMMLQVYIWANMSSVQNRYIRQTVTYAS